jgi:hypothetical protein
MSDFDRNLRDPGNESRIARSGYSTGSVVGAAIVAVLILVVIGYVFTGRSMKGPTVIEHPAATTTAPAPIAPAVTPPSAPASPDSAPKP